MAIKVSLVLLAIATCLQWQMWHQTLRFAEFCWGFWDRFTTPRCLLQLLVRSWARREIKREKGWVLQCDKLLYESANRLCWNRLQLSIPPLRWVCVAVQHGPLGGLWHFLDSARDYDWLVEKIIQKLGEVALKRRLTPALKSQSEMNLSLPEFTPAFLIPQVSTFTKIKTNSFLISKKHYYVLNLILGFIVLYLQIYNVLWYVIIVAKHSMQGAAFLVEYFFDTRTELESVGVNESWSIVAEGTDWKAPFISCPKLIELCSLYWLFNDGSLKQKFSIPTN